MLSKKHKYIIATLVIILIVGALVFVLIRNQKFKKDLTTLRQDLTEIKQNNHLLERKSKADNLFITGDYDSAMTIYSYIEDSISNNSFIMERRLRMKRVQNLKSALDSTQSMTSSQIASMEREMEKREKVINEKNEDKLDSISGYYRGQLSALEKQLNQTKSKLKDQPEIGRLSFYNANGTRISYFGELKFGKANGDGMGHYSSNSVYDGEWKNNMKHGEGTYKWADGHKYVGDYVKDKREGKGTYYWNTGEKYEGSWKNDKRNGYGILYDKNGVVKFKGIWKDDEFVKEADKQD
ncbi:MORN repeat-containing protein [Salibacter halophilus]|uniref:Phosphatidylinositol-4-phosphate 5-kinase n=1 Tax=Salibacter halophilus TaxID=1803916 RepID=A0A6N6M8W3_9FLAO|nr:hypothetical protein [Salibacter halophilus]KAB1065496.1 hypothetical protein F3059_02250 [Salibacter halophilus]